MAIEKELLDQLLAGRDPSEVFGKDGLLDDLKKALSERILNAELDEHLESEHDEAGSGNRRNGSSRKTVLTGTSKMTLSIPRDRAGTFDPKLIAKYQRRFPDFDEKIISMYARGITVREIQGHLAELYGIEVSPDLISAVTDAVLEEVREWQNRLLELCYPLVFFDAIRVKIRDEGFVRNKAVYIVLAVLADGTKEILGLWIDQTEGAKFWLRVMNELKNRGCQDILIAVVDGLKGFPEAITAAFPQTTVQTCVVHLIRHSLEFVCYKDRKPVVPALRAIYRAKDAEAGLEALEAFEAGYWGQKYPAIAQSWRRNWEQGYSILRLSRGRTPDHLHHECYRGAQFKAATRRANAWTLSQRRSGNEAVISGTQQRRRGMETSSARVVEAKTQFAIVFGERFFNR